MVHFVEPNTYQQALRLPQAEVWKKAVEEEVMGLVSKDTWEVVQ
jgi:hypothetical protein